MPASAPVTDSFRPAARHLGAPLPGGALGPSRIPLLRPIVETGRASAGADHGLDAKVAAVSAPRLAALPDAVHR